MSFNEPTGTPGAYRPVAEAREGAPQATGTCIECMRNVQRMNGLRTELGTAAGGGNVEAGFPAARRACRAAIRADLACQALNLHI